MDNAKGLGERGQVVHDENARIGQNINRLKISWSAASKLFSDVQAAATKEDVDALVAAYNANNPPPDKLPEPEFACTTFGLPGYSKGMMVVAYPGGYAEVILAD